jgi:predicted ester cyclase
MKKNNLDIIREIMEEGFENSNFEVIDRYVSEDLIEHQFGARQGKDGIKGIIKELHSGLSELHYTLQKNVVDGDLVWSHYKATAIQSGSFMHMPPSGKPISIDIMDIGRIENGLLVEHWGIPDRFAVMMQLGVFNKKETVS